MSNEIENNVQNATAGISTYKMLSDFREPLIKSIIDSLNIPSGSKGLDAGCGIGSVSNLLARVVGEKGDVIGLDISKDFLHYAEKSKQIRNINYVEGNVNSLQFDSNTFDWIWSSDTVWPGPKEFDCPAEDPHQIIKEFYRVLKPGGSIFLLFWSSQKLLAGYPLLEAQLNTTSSATAPFRKGMDPLNHIMNGRYWLKKANFDDISVKTYVQDVIGPINKDEQKVLSFLFQMFWSAAESEIPKKDWLFLKKITNSDSDNYILNNNQYYGFYTYTLFKAKK